MFDENIKFKYTWRPYQERVLAQVDRLIDDKKVHIVAAPGSGKTVLGLELARRLEEAVLILSPTLTIKNQWIDRFVTLFMKEGSKKPDWISDNIYELKFFNSVTYQGLHCAYKKISKILNDEEDTDDLVLHENIDNSVDVKNYNLIKEIKKNNIKTIILDEAHHLKNGWWNSLVKVVESIPDVVIISLTATPPYDIPHNEWKRYVSLCGDIDAEINVPELVKEKNLCPHQDYVYFSYPTATEKDMIKKYEDDVKKLMDDLTTNVDFINLIKNHPYIVDSDVYIEEILENPKFYSSMLVLLKACGIDITKEHVRVLGHSKNVPELNSSWLEVLLQNILFDNRDTFKDMVFLENIEKRLNEIGAIEKKEVVLTDNKQLQKYFINSISKLDSIVSIVKSEYQNMGNELRMVILTDYLRKEYLDLADVEINKIGVFPVLIKLLKENININMAVLTGSLFLVPKAKKDKLLGIIGEMNINVEDIFFEELENVNSYLIVKTKERYKNKLMNVISKLFSLGEVNIIIGTKSLLGEGWDEQSINSLVLASFVGSYVLSNQMRGRAIRVSDNSNKTANVWHLVCVDNVDRRLINNPDYEMMKRRFNSFVGIGYNTNVVESGIDRLDTIPTVFNETSVNNYNIELMNLSNRRNDMYNKWFSLVNDYDTHKMNVNEEISVEKNNMKNKFTFIQYSRLLWLALSTTFIYILCNIRVGSTISVKELMSVIFVTFILTIIVNFKLIIQCVKRIIFSVPKNQLKYVAKCVVRSLCEAGFIDGNYYSIKINIKDEDDDPRLRFSIENVTAREKVLIINALEEIFSKVENQRYILVNKKIIVSTYYNVPEIMSTNKKLAELFHKYWTKYVGVSTLVYTKSIKGRKVLLEARTNSFDYSNENDLFEKKKKLSSWE